MYINNKLKVTPGKWVALFDGIIDTNSLVTAKGQELKWHIGNINEYNPDHEKNQYAIVDAVNFFKSLDVELLKKQKEFCFKSGGEEAIGLSNIIDEIQDILVDSFGAEESEVFNLT